MNNEEKIKNFIGEPFTFFMTNGDSFPAVMVAFDKNIGITILALDLVDSSGRDHSNIVDENGNLCLMSGDAKKWTDPEEFVEHVYESFISKIVDGIYGGEYHSIRTGNPKCSFAQS